MSIAFLMESIDVLYDFGCEKEILVIVDLETMLSKSSQQFIDYLYVEELCLFAFF